MGLLITFVTSPVSVLHYGLWRKKVLKSALLPKGEGGPELVEGPDEGLH